MAIFSFFSLTHSLIDCRLYRYRGVTVLRPGWVIWKYWTCPCTFFSLGQLAIVSALSTPNGGKGYNSSSDLKVLTNEKRGGLSVVSFDRSPYKLFSLKFSNRLVQAPSCERHKTAPRTLFVSFANNIYFQIAV